MGSVRDMTYKELVKEKDDLWNRRYVTKEMTDEEHEATMPRFVELCDEIQKRIREVCDGK